LTHLINLADGEGVQLLRVPSSRNAIPFYERAGFIQDTEQPDSDAGITWMTRERDEYAEQGHQRRRGIAGRFQRPSTPRALWPTLYEKINLK